MGGRPGSSPMGSPPIPRKSARSCTTTTAQDGEFRPMRIAWFIHRYFPCVGGAENYGRAMVRRFVEAGHEVDVVTSDAHDLWYFTNKTRRRIDAPAESIEDGAR